MDFVTYALYSMDMLKRNEFNRGIKMADETKEQKFIRIANKRVNNAIKQIQLVGNLASAQYGKTDEQVAAIELALSDAIVKTMNKFNNVKIAKASFSL